MSNASLAVTVHAAGGFNSKVNGRRKFICLLGFILLLLTACGPVGTFGPTVPQIPVSGEEAEPPFREFYQALGSQEVLGQPISEMVERDGKQCQFFEAVLMCFNPNEDENNRRYQLEPLGYELSLVDDPGLTPQADPRDRDLGGGFWLFHEFIGLYDRIYGSLYAGRPLTQLRLNHAMRRYEQFFENVGFYRSFDEPAGRAHLIHYGAFLCGPDCSRELNDFWLTVESGAISQPFELALQRAKWTGLGRPVTQARLTADGMIEQVYDNAFLYAPVDEPAHIHMRPLVLWNGNIAIQPLVERNPHEQLVFYEVENGLGHNVPLFFDSYIAALGGREVAGRPLTELFPTENGCYRQCFESYCLDYRPDAQEGQRVSMVDLGWQYAKNTDPGQIARRFFSPETLEIQLNEEKSQVGRGEEQRILMRVISRTNGQPVRLVPARVTLLLPDRAGPGGNFPPTDGDGRAEAVLPPLDGLPAMSVVEYQVCLELPGNTPVCAVDSFVYRGE